MTPAEARTHAPLWDAAALADPHRQSDKARRVQRMFDAIAPRYELVNALSSLGQDKYWRRRAVALAQVTPADRVLDIACGTGDFARAFVAGGAEIVIGADFAGDMLRRAAVRRTPHTAWMRCDALALPFGDGQFTLASCAFGVRNFQSLVSGLREMHRVLTPDGRAVVLEFSLPRNAAIRALYRAYLERVLPRFASIVSGDRTGAYRYLARSIVSFADEAQMTATFLEAGFATVRCEYLSLGAVHVYIARKESPTGSKSVP